MLSLKIFQFLVYSVFLNYHWPGVSKAVAIFRVFCKILHLCLYWLQFRYLCCWCLFSLGIHNKMLSLRIFQCLVYSVFLNSLWPGVSRAVAFCVLSILYIGLLWLQWYSLLIFLTCSLVI